jgi:hypothetical protein
MKKIITLFAVVIAIGFFLTSCSKEKNSVSLIEGKWAYFQKGIETSEGEDLKSFEHENLCGKNYVEFLKDGTVNECSYYHEGTCKFEVDSGSWNKEGDDLTIKFPLTEKETAKIVELDEKTLKVKASVNGVNIIYVYKKVI